MSKSTQLFFILSATVCTLAAVCGKRQLDISCQNEECQLSPAHFKLYSNIKQALENHFNIDGKDVIPFLRAVEVLKLRYAQQEESGTYLNGSKLVGALLNNNNLKVILKQLNSESGRELINLYKSSVGGRRGGGGGGLACSKWRRDELEAAKKKLDANDELAIVFNPMHLTFLEKSARKCLKQSCRSIDEHMSKLDSVLRRRNSFRREEANEVSAAENNSLEESLPVQVEPTSSWREFDSEEKELCYFFKRTNASDCQISGNELSKIKFTSPQSLGKENEGADRQLSKVEDFVEEFRLNRLPAAQIGGGNGELVQEAAQETRRHEERERAKSFVLAQCRSINRLLDYNLAGLKYYIREKFIDAHKLNARSDLCPSLSYWLEIARLCSELEIVFARSETSSFAY